MKNISLIFFLLNFSFLFSQNTAYKIPDELLINRQLSKSQYIKNDALHDPQAPSVRSMRAVGESEDTSIILFLDNIFPIGWSKDGKFAYVKPIKGERDGDYDLDIIDLKNDSLLSSLILSHRDSRERSLTESWSSQYKEIDSILSINKIIQQKEFVLNEFPIWVMSKDGEGGNQDEWLYLNTTIDFNSKIGDNRTFENKLTYNIQSSTKGLKIINESYYYPETNWGFSNLGYLKSPYENRIALLNTKTSRWSCGGPPAQEVLYILGVHLKSGFKK
jgi:hypothetical protein